MTGEGEHSVELGNMPAEAYLSPWSLQSLRTCFDDDDNEALLEAEVSIVYSLDEVLEKKAVVCMAFLWEIELVVYDRGWNRLCAASLYTFRVRLLLVVYANSSSPSFLATIELRQMAGTDHGIT